MKQQKPFALGIEVAMSEPSVGRLAQTIEMFSKTCYFGSFGYDVARYVDGLRAGLYARIGA